MTFVMDAPTATTDLATAPNTHAVPLRLFLLGRAGALLFTSLYGTVLFCFWVTFVAISPITFLAPVVLPLTALVRWYANNRRRGAERLVGPPIRADYREAPRSSVLSRVITIVKDPSSWRDALWLFLHPIVTMFASALSLALFFGGVFYLIYPFLYWVTPPRVFNRPFGGLVHLHSVGGACGMMPFAIVSFALWFALAIPLARADASLTRSLLGRRRSA
jgi:hypothetical protein